MTSMSRRALVLVLSLLAMCVVACGDDTDPTDSSVTDTGGMDASGRDAATDSGVDAGASDIGAFDSGASDADAGAADSGDLDAASPDASIPDAGTCPASPAECVGVCSLVPPRCDGIDWVCDEGPGYEATETSCDGFDNDCDGTIDEGCSSCTVDEAELRSHLFSIADIDFDFACNGYLTSLVSGPDFAWVVPSSTVSAASQYFGQANQNMGYALVDPNAQARRVVVTYSCCASCGCLAQNGLTLLHTCTATTPGCGCAGQSNCPGFLDAPFLAAGYEDAVVPWGTIATPGGLAAGPGGSYFVGNWRPASCDASAACVACDPSTSTYCSASDAPCCDTTAVGRLAQFTLPEGAVEASFRVVEIFDGEVILGLAAGRSGEVMVGTSSSGVGRLHRFDPVQGTASLVQSYGGAVVSISQDRRSGDWYLEEVGTSSSTLHRLSEQGVPLALPQGVPLHPSGRGAIQFGPDDQLYRVVLSIGGQSTLEIMPIP